MKKSSKDIHISGLYTIIATILGAILGGIITHYYSTNDGLSDNQLLQKAEKFYKQEEYIQAIQIYEDERLKNNTIALNNLAYIYLYDMPEKYIINAKECFKRASEIDKEYLEEYIAITITHPQTYNEVFWLLKRGVDEENKNAERFIYACLENIGKEKEISIKDFCALNYDEMKSILKAATEGTTIREIQGKVIDSKSTNDFFEIESSEPIKTEVGKVVYDDTLHVDKLYGNILFANIKKTSFKFNYIFAGAIEYIELDELK